MISIPYVTVAEAKDYLRLNDVDADEDFDEHLAATIPPLCELADDLTGRKFGELGRGFESHTLTVEYALSNPQWQVMLPEWPIVTVDSFLVDGVAVDHRPLKSIGIIDFIDSGRIPMQRCGMVNVVATVGYAEVPSAVKLAIFRALSYIKQRHDEEGLGAELLGPMQVTWRTTMDREHTELHDVMNSHLSEYILDVMCPQGGVVL